VKLATRLHLVPRSRMVDTKSDNKVPELTTVCLPWQQWTETSVRSNNVGISSFHSCVVVDLCNLFMSGVYYSLNVFCCAVANNSCILYHDNAPVHTAPSVREFLAIKQITVLIHPPYSSVLAPNDIFLFPKIKF
jgi:hypothetical protein